MPRSPRISTRTLRRQRTHAQHRDAPRVGALSPAAGRAARRGSPTGAGGLRVPTLPPPPAPGGPSRPARPFPAAPGGADPLEPQPGPGAERGGALRAAGGRRRRHSGGGGGMNGTGREPCGHGEALAAGARPLVSALMFSAGLLGNLLALGLLLRCRRPPRARPPSLFHVLVLALVVTDLLGTCSVSPFVLASYHRNLTLTALGRGGHICLYFGFAMSFFGLATMLVLFAMALERCLALGRPYFYERFLSPRAGLVALPAIYTFSAAFCSLPLLGFGRYVQYCPGTWCFIQMRVDDGRHKAAGLHVTFSLLYATLLLFLILSVLLCNLSVIANLARMCRRGQRTRRLATLEQPRGVGGSGRRIFSMAEEIDHLLLLAIMTITFVICSLPFTVSAAAPPRCVESQTHRLVG